MNDFEARLRNSLRHNLDPIDATPHIADDVADKARVRRVIMIVGAGMAVVLLGASTVWTASVLSSDPSQRPAAPAPSQSPHVSARVDLGESAEGVVSDSTAAWVTASIGGSGCQGKLWKVEADSNRVIETSRLELAPDDIISAFGSLWIEGFQCTADGSGTTGVVQRLDPNGQQALGTISTSYSELFGIAAGEDAIWVGANDETTSGHLLRIDPTTNEVVADIPLDGYVTSVETGEGSVWAPVGRGEQPSVVYQIDPATHEVVRTVGIGSSFVVAGGGFVWVERATPPGSTIVSAVRIDPRTGEEVGDPVLLGDTVFHPFAADEAGVWFIGGRGRATVAHLNATTLAVEEQVEVGDTHALDAYLDPTSGTIWLAGANRGSARLIQVDTRE